MSAQDDSSNTNHHHNNNNEPPNFVISNTIEASFEYKGYHKFGRVLGRGRFGTVIECVRKADNTPIAMKFFKCSGIHRWIPEQTVKDPEEKEFQHSEFFYHKAASQSSNHSVCSSTTTDNRVLPSEVACLIRAAQIPGIVKILDYLPASGEVQFEDVEDLNDEGIIGIVLERNPSEICLFDYLMRRQVLNENEARFIIRQLVTINLELLQAGILHGDLKSENILIEPSTLIIKLIDFGSAQLIETNTQCKSNKSSSSNSSTKLVKTFRGTNLYKPPEYLMNKCFYPRPSTVWTIGIILYDLICGQFPFKTDSDILEYKNKDLEFPSKNKNVSMGFKSLVRKCLTFYVADRISIDKILTDQWMTASDA